MADAAIFGYNGNTVKDGILQVGVHDVVRTDFGPEEGAEKTVDDGRDIPLNVTHLELLGREFTVQVKDCELSGDSLGHMGGQDRFASVGGGEKDAAFLFDQEIVEVHIGAGILQSVIDPLVGALDGHDADSIRHLLELLDLGRNGGEGCRVFDKRSSTEKKLMKTQPVMRVTQINLTQR